MYIAGREEMHMLDAYTMDRLGLPGAVLMENAGAAVAGEIMRDFPDTETKIAVLVGGGNNGGDGSVIARRLRDFGYDAVLVRCVEEEKLKGDAELHYRVYKSRKLPVVEWTPACIQQADVIVDALLGTGVQGRLREPFSSIIREVNGAKGYVYAVDVPSGVNADTGEVVDMAIRADKTVTFVLPKKGFYLQQGPRYVGEVLCADISVPPSLVEELGLELPGLIDPVLGKVALPKRPAYGHKGTFGHVLVMGGCRQYVGATVYTAKAAFHSGAGLVTLAVPESIYPLVAAQAPESLLLPLQEEEGSISATAFQDNKIDLSPFTTIAFGPGLGRKMDGTSLLRKIMAESAERTLIIDADGLYFAREILEEFRSYKGNVIFTPHPGEMAHLTGLSVREIEEDRLGAAKQFAQKYGIHLLLKGHRPILTTPAGEQFVNPYGNDALGKGGSGDVLTGLIASFNAQGASPLDALIAASYYHATAAEQLGKERSTYGVVPSDLIDHIRKIL
ncbi:MAG: NAD(P)H-hydrate dehydratase [Lysinibacillus sp.]